MKDDHRKQINVRMDDEVVRTLDAIRRQEDDLPDRSKMIRRLIMAHAKEKVIAGTRGRK